MKEAKKFGDTLIVVLSHDKNNDKPYAVLAKERKEMLESLGVVDEVVIGDAYDKVKIVLEIKPDIIALGYDQVLPKNVVDCRCVKIKKLGNHSTKNLR